MEPTQKEDKGSLIPFIIIILGLFLWIGYQYYISSQGSVKTIGTVVACGTPDARYKVTIWYEFKAGDSTYTEPYKTVCSFCNCDGKPTCIGEKYPVVYAIKDPTITSIDLLHPVTK
ncbi:MAG: hypothetical protein EOO55_02155 [Hymenobacter sp.]|nr:MAG: hypothetical protein EOO55_02155 [Hymenobacter sp.]